MDRLPNFLSLRVRQTPEVSCLILSPTCAFDATGARTMNLVGDNCSLLLSTNITIPTTTKTLQKKKENSGTKHMHNTRRQPD